MFVGLHALLAMRLKVPELEMTLAEGVEFTKAAQNVMRHYSVRTTQKTMDWIAFAGVTAGLYAPRIMAARIRVRMEAEARREARNEASSFSPHIEPVNGINWPQ